MEEVGGTGQGEKDKKGQHAGLEWEGIIQRYKEGLSSTPGGSHHLTEHDWGKPLLTQLPWEDVLFASILPHLEPDDWLALSCTCKAFNKMVKEFTKQNKRLVFQPESGSAQIFKQLTRHSVSLRVAAFPFCTWLTDELLQPVVENNLLLERLDISGCNSLTDTLLLRVSVCLTRLTHLTLSHCPWVSGASIDFLAFHHSKRESTRKAIGDDETQYQEMNPCDSLQLIGHSGLRTKTKERKKSRYVGKDKLYRDLNSAAFIAKIRRKQCREWRLGKDHPGLQALALSDCSPSISDADVCRLASSFPCLVELSIGQNKLLTDSCLSSVARSLNHLVSIDVNGCPKMTDKGIFTVAKLCKRLKTANVTNCTFTKKMTNYLKIKRGLRFRSNPVTPTTVTSQAPGMTAAMAVSPAVQISPAFQVAHNRDKLISPQILRKLEEEERR